MEAVKEFIKENKLLIIAGIIIVIICSCFYYYHNKKNEVNYDPGESADISYIKREYKANEYSPVTVELIDVLNEYYSYFMKKQVFEPEEAYEMLTDNSKKDFGSKEEYLKDVDNITTINALKNKIEEYRVDKNNEHIIEIVDSEDNKFTIEEAAVWDFKISIDGKK